MDTTRLELAEIETKADLGQGSCLATCWIPCMKITALTHAAQRPLTPGLVFITSNTDSSTHQSFSPRYHLWVVAINDLQSVAVGIVSNASACMLQHVMKAACLLQLFGMHHLYSHAQRHLHGSYLDCQSACTFHVVSDQPWEREFAMEAANIRKVKLLEQCGVTLEFFLGQEWQTLCLVL